MTNKKVVVSELNGGNPITAEVSPNFMCTNSRIAEGGIDVPLFFNLQKDSSLPGYGQPISVKLAERLITDYCNQCDEIEEYLNSLLIKYPELKDSIMFEVVRSYFDSKNHVVTGVFGRETLMQLLSKPFCEGIRYAIIHYDKKMTIMLQGEQFSTPQQEENAAGNSGTEPLGGRVAIREALGRPNATPDDPLMYDVKGGSGTRAELRRLIERNENKSPLKESGEVKNYGQASLLVSL